MANGSNLAEIIVVFCTVPDLDTGTRMARTLVEEKRCACVNLVPGLRSIYRWEGKLTEDAEVLCIIKTTRAAFEPLRARICELHPYQVPEVVALPVSEAHRPYLDWVAQSVE